jgi:hypothetical protein
LARLAARDIDGLRLARTGANRQIAIDELAVVDDGHGPIVRIGLDSSGVAFSNRRDTIGG